MKVQKFTLAYTLVTIFLILAGIGYSLLSNINRIWLDNREVVANLAVAVVAHERAGDDIPFEVDYSRIDTWFTWSWMETNSVWLADNTYKVVPMLVYEEVSAYPGTYPIGVGFMPNLGYRSMHVLGTAYIGEGYVFLNDRYMIDELWNDEADMLGTLVHELIHIQEGNFIKGPSEDFEANTSAATVEVLAAMCNQGHAVACRAFWSDIEHMARAGLMDWFGDRGLDQYYQKLADLLFRDDVEERAARKSVRYWSDNQEQLQYIIEAYSLKPWYEIVIPGVMEPGYKLDTGIFDTSMGWPPFVVGMSFDDADDLLSDLWLYLGWLYGSK